MYIIIDYDSTFSKVEALDVLGEIALENHPERESRLKKISDITDLGMNGELSFTKSLEERIAVLNANKSQIDALIMRLKDLVSESTKRCSWLFEQYKGQVYIVSSGFKEFIAPVVADFGIDADHVYANNFVYDKEGNIVGFDESNPLSKDQGKVKLMEALKFEGDIHVIGDGYTDYEIRKHGYAQHFYAFVENKRREKVVAVADHVIDSFDQFIEINDLKKN